MLYRLRALALTMLIGTGGARPLQSQAADSAALAVTAPACGALDGAQFAVCQAAHDAVFSALPAVSILIGGGNPKLGTAGVNGTFGGVTLTLRATHSLVVLPSTKYDGGTDTVRFVTRHHATLPSLDMGFGLFKKEMPIGTVGAEFLGTIFLMDPDQTPLWTYPDGVRKVAGYAVGFGWGMRLGLNPKGPLPFASLTATKRTLPSYTYGDFSDGSTYTYTLGVSAINARLLLGKQLGKMELTLGGGADLLTGTYSVLYTDPDTEELQPQVDSTRSAMRIVTTANAAFDLKPLRVTFEGGYQVGKDEKLPTIVRSVDQRSGRFFAGAGVSVKF